MTRARVDHLGSDRIYLPQLRRHRGRAISKYGFQIDSTAPYYFSSNDRVSFAPRRPLPERNFDGRCSLIGVANIYWLHVFAMIAAEHGVRHATAFDVNTRQLAFLNAVIAIVERSEGRLAFIENLLCTRFRDNARARLAAVTGPRTELPGTADNSTALFDEAAIWRGATFDAARFEKVYGLRAALAPFGLHVRLSGKVVGGFDDYLVALDYGDPRHAPHPFCLGYGRGLLADEGIFATARRALFETRIEIVRADIRRDLPALVMRYRYDPLYLWYSNTMQSYYLKRDPLRFPAIRRLYEHAGVHDFLPELDIVTLQDRRPKEHNPAVTLRGFTRRNYARSTPHTKAFRAVAPFMTGARQLEVTPVAANIIEDQHGSRLPDCTMIHLDDFMLDSSKAQYDVILLHVIMGHGYPPAVFDAVMAKARRLAARVVVLEHNPKSADFADDPPCGYALTDIERHEPEYKQLVPGVKAPDRNVVYLFEGPIGAQASRPIAMATSIRPSRRRREPHIAACL